RGDTAMFSLPSWPRKSNTRAGAEPKRSRRAPRRTWTRCAVEELEPRILLASGAALTPGSADQVVRVQFRFLSERADYRDEVGLCQVDDALGRIGALRPGDAGYTAAALDPARRRVLFRRGQSPGRAQGLDLPGGGHFCLYLIANGTTEQFLRRN